LIFLQLDTPVPCFVLSIAVMERWK